MLKDRFISMAFFFAGGMIVSVLVALALVAWSTPAIVSPLTTPSYRTANELQLARWSTRIPRDPLPSEDSAWHVFSVPDPAWNSLVAACRYDKAGADMPDEIFKALSKGRQMPGRTVVLLERAVGFPFASFHGRRWYIGSGYENGGTSKSVVDKSVSFVRMIQWNGSWERRFLPLNIWWPEFIFNSAVFAVVLIALRAVLCAALHRFRRRRGVCPSCSYELGGSEGSSCPECGSEVCGSEIMPDSA